VWFPEFRPDFLDHADALPSTTDRLLHEGIDYPDDSRPYPLSSSYPPSECPAAPAFFRNHVTGSEPPFWFPKAMVASFALISLQTAFPPHAVFSSSFIDARAGEVSSLFGHASQGDWCVLQMAMATLVAAFL